MDKTFENMIQDQGHWHGLVPPLAPNEEEVALYEELIGKEGPVYLLGMTKQLLPLCDVAVDLCPVETNKQVLQQNWLEMSGFRAKVMIGDGVINLAGPELLTRVSQVTEKFISRVFLERHEWMKYATYFPNEFPTSSYFKKTQPKIAMVVWTF